MVTNLVSKYKCNGCLACIDSCPQEALIMVLKKDGHMYASCNESLCIECKICEKVCTCINDLPYGQNGKKSIPYAAWTVDNDLRIKSSSGGVFSAIATTFINNGDYICGAIIDGLHIKHILTNDISDLKKIQGSKYLQSNTTGIYKQIKRILLDHKVLFSGTGCQVAGIISYVKVVCPEKSKNLYCIDLVCDGVPSYSLLTKTIENCPQKIDSIVSFRNKSKGWESTPKCLIVKSDNEVFNLGENNLMISGFNRALSDRYSCFDCKYAYSDRMSDITIADFWGIEEYKEEYNNGISLIIIHDEKGRDLIKMSDLLYHDTTWETAVKENYRVINGYRPWYKYNLARLLQSVIFSNFSYKTLSRLYWKGILSKRDIFWIPYFFYLKILNFKIKNNDLNSYNRFIFKK